MEFLNFLREEPIMAWLVFLAFLLVLVPVAVFWRSRLASNRDDATNLPVQATKPTRFGNRTELLIILIGMLLLLIAFFGLYRFFFD